VNILLCLSHSIEESQQLQLFHELGYGVASIGGYIDPAHPHDPKRPALPQVPMVPEVKAAVDSLGTPDNLGAAQSRIPDAILDWLGDDGVIVYHHYLDRLFGQWDRIRDWMDGSPRRRVIWRSVGQSVAHNENQAMPFRRDGLERVAYSPKEANIPGYSGHDALIRFWMDPEEYKGWTGEDPVVINITQHLAQRHPYTNYEFWRDATEGLPAMPLGPGSEAIGGPGELSYEDMHTALRRARAYLYTGTQPASYTLGLIEAMMTGIPVVSIGPSHHSIFPYGPDLFEGHELVGTWAEDPPYVRNMLRSYLTEPERATFDSVTLRQRAIDLFGKATIAEQWKAFLG
jgi:hypothetical protein